MAAAKIAVLRKPTSKARQSSRATGRDSLEKLGERVRALRHQRNMTQEELAHALSLSVAYVSLIERGGRNSPYLTVVAIARALGVPTSKLCES